MARMYKYYMTLIYRKRPEFQRKDDDMAILTESLAQALEIATSLRYRHHADAITAAGTMARSSEEYGYPGDGALIYPLGSDRPTHVLSFGPYGGISMKRAGG